MSIRIPRMAKLAVVGAMALAVLGLTGGPASASSTPAPPTGKVGVSPTMKPKGKVNLLPLDSNGRPAGTKAAPRAGLNSSIDFGAPSNNCYGNLTYTPIVNHASYTQYFVVYLYNGGATRTYYSYVAANSTAWPYFYGVMGSYTASVYVWNGSSYAYDEYEISSNNCSVSVTVTKTIYTGYLYATITNYGTDTAWVELNELAPYHTYGSYTGDHWYYPAAGGGVIHQYIYVGTDQPYGIYADVLGSTYYTWQWYGTY